MGDCLVAQQIRRTDSSDPPPPDRLTAAIPRAHGFPLILVRVSTPTHGADTPLREHRASPVAVLPALKGGSQLPVPHGKRARRPMRPRRCIGVSAHRARE